MGVSPSEDDFVWGPYERLPLPHVGNFHCAVAENGPYIVS